MQITVNLTNEQLAYVDNLATRTGQDREEIVLRAVKHMSILDRVAPDEYAAIAAGLKDMEEGRITPPEQIDALLRKYSTR